MQTEATRQLVQRFLEARAANDAATIDGLLADDAVWAPPKTVGIGPFEGRETCVKALTGGAIGKIFDMSTLKRTVTKLLADGDTAVALQHLSATTVKGEAYENDYCWVYTCRDGKISRLDEYTDTLHAGRIMGFAKS